MTEKLPSNPLNPFTFVAIFSLLEDAYGALHPHWTGWLVALPLLRSILAVPFLILYFLKSPSAWLACLLSTALIVPTYLLIRYFTQPTHPPSTGVALVIGFFYVATIAFIVLLRGRYHAYLKSLSEPVLEVQRRDS